MRDQGNRCARWSRKAFGGLGAVLALGILLAPGIGKAKYHKHHKHHKNNPVRLALQVDNGVGLPIDLVKGETYSVDIIDLSASVTSTADEGLYGLRTSGDFADLDWRGVTQVDEEPVRLANADGTFTRRRFYRGANWMENPGVVWIDQVDAQGHMVGFLGLLSTGSGHHRSPTDSFFVRRMRAIQWTFDCPLMTDCTGASNFKEEALVELRNVTGHRQAFKLHPRTAAIRIIWSQRPLEPFYVPVHQVKRPTFAYGFDIDVDPITPPNPDGTYSAGSAVSFRVTLRDGEGTALHPPGFLPTYTDAVINEDPAGIRYYSAFFDQTTTYYRRKHHERMLMAQIIGPAQDIQPIRSFLTMGDFLTPGTQLSGTMARDGVYSEVQTLPQGSDLFGGAFDPTHAGWVAPVSDVVTFHIPADAPDGTYLVTLKGRRVYMGEDIPDSTTIEIQVGSPIPTHAHLTTGGCQKCHNNGGELSTVLHANANRAACAGCHAPLSFEPEGPIFVRLHFIHSRSGRFDAGLDNCSNCHLSQASIQRTSQAACLSCHKSYPAWHEGLFGPVESMYVGGGANAFANCTDSCHRNHPGSHLGAEGEIADAEP